MAWVGNTFLREAKSQEARTELLADNIVELKSSQYGFTGNMVKFPQIPKAFTVVVEKEDGL